MDGRKRREVRRSVPSPSPHLQSYAFSSSQPSPFPASWVSEDVRFLKTYFLSKEGRS